MGKSPLGPFEMAPCPACGAERCDELASADDLRRELEAVWSFHMRRLRAGLPVRNLVDRTVFSQDPPLRLAACGECGTVHRNPREAEEAATELYEEEELDRTALESLFEVQRDAARTQAERLTRVAGRAGRGLEIGSYIGAFLSAAGEIGWRFEGRDVNPTAVELSRERGLTANVGSIDDLDDAGGFDAVAFWNCFDQLPDPAAAARAARAALSPGGLIALRVPNGAFYARWRRRLGGPLGPLATTLLAHNNLLGFPYRYGFTPASLSGLLRSAGFEPIESVGDTLVRLADRWTRGWAMWEERAVKAAIRGSTTRPDSMPWFEIYARAV